ncbi:MAG: zinc-dependent metalloprotease [Rubrivivax sp.]|nr:zinc-dependent metalloprotease [Rubrivivax sp.]
MPHTPKLEAAPTLERPGPRPTTWACLVLATALAGCATAASAPLAVAQPTGDPKPAAPAASASGAAPAARPPAPGALAPFAEVTRDAQRSDGFLPLWKRDDKVWLEIPAARLNQPLFLGVSLASGLGERFVFPGLMGRSQVVVLRRVGNSLQMVARNLHARAPAGSPLANALAESYSDSLMGSAPLAAAPHASSKALLVDAAALLGGDIGGLQTWLEAGYRMAYSLDRANSSIEKAGSLPSGTALTFRQHFAVPRLPAPPVSTPGSPPPNPAAMPSPSRVVPDARSLFVSVAYTLAPLPAEPMKARLADPRVGYFTQAHQNFGDDRQEGRRTHFIERWRLEKKDPAAAVSEPREPLRVVMDRNIPEQWRAPVRAGILEWNKAFERAGLRNAIAVEQQPADADWSAIEGTRLLAVRWFAQEGPGAVAVAPSQADPRTGELLRGAAIIPENWVRVFRSRALEAEPRLADAGILPGEFAQRLQQCSYAHDALQQAVFGFELLQLRGELEADGPKADRFIADALKDVVMHEVGHALGLRHNFRASAGVSPAQLRDPAYTASRGVSHSVMDYNALNTPLDGETVADYHMATLGAYDYWAIEYGYREFADASQEKAELARIANLSATDPALSYATDEDLASSDPLVNQRDLGSDPLGFAQRQIQLARELWQRTQKRTLAADDDMSLYRRNLERGFATLGAALPMATRYVGGTYTSRALAGAGQALLVPVPAAQQVAALDLIVGQLFSSASFRFDPEFMSRLGVDRLERGAGTDFSLPGAVLGLQRAALDHLMSDGLATRLADAEARVADPARLLSYADVQRRLSQAIWAELGIAKGKAPEIDSLRRNLQREHLRRLAGGLLRPGSSAATDVRAVHRQTALQLQARLSAALSTPRGSDLVRAHLEDSLASLSEALKAPLSRQGV